MSDPSHDRPPYCSDWASDITGNALKRSARSWTVPVA